MDAFMLQIPYPKDFVQPTLFIPIAQQHRIQNGFYQIRLFYLPLTSFGGVGYLCLEIQKSHTRI